MALLFSSRATDLLRETYRKLQEDAESGWGPDSVSDTEQEASAGEGGAENELPVADMIDLYLSEIADLVAMENDLDDEAISDLIYKVADELNMPIPAEEDDDAEIVVWLGKAKTNMFAARVLTAVRENLAD